MHTIQRPKKVKSNLEKRLQFADDILSHKPSPDELDWVYWQGYAQHLKQVVK